VVVGVAYSVDGAYCTWGAVQGPLAAGASVTIGSDGGPCTIANGTHAITAFADDVDRIVELDKTNNQVSQTITVSGSGQLPDLIPTSLSYNSATDVFTSVVKNQGAAATPTGVVIGVAYSVDGAKCTWGVVQGPLAAGASVTIGSDGGPCAIASGTHTITIFADDVDRIAESNKNNNMLSEQITVP
jgi:subtilase family serine protease